MNNPEQDLLDAMASSQRTLGASIPRLVTRKPQVAMNALKHQCSCQSLFMPPTELADYLAVGAQTVQEWEPVGITEIQVLQRIIDTGWNFNRALALQGNLYNFGMAIESRDIQADNPDLDEQSLAVSAQCHSYLKQCADPFEKLGRHTTRMQRTLKLLWAEFKELSAERLKKRGSQYNAETCPALNWYLKLAKLADQLVESRQELKAKTTPIEVPEEIPTTKESTTSNDPLFCKSGVQLTEPLTEKAAEIFDEAGRNGLLLKEEIDLFKKPAGA